MVSPLCNQAGQRDNTLERTPVYMSSCISHLVTFGVAGKFPSMGLFFFKKNWLFYNENVDFFSFTVKSKSSNVLGPTFSAWQTAVWSAAPVPMKAAGVPNTIQGAGWGRGTTSVTDVPLTWSLVRTQISTYVLYRQVFFLDSN